MDQECGQVLLITSSAGGEGKTTTAINTAYGLAQIQPDKVLLIDADLRKPGVRVSLAGVANGRLGPSDGFQQLLDSPNGTMPVSFGRVRELYVLAASADGPSRSHKRLTSLSLRKALARLRKQFKYIIIDSPPLLPMVDSHLLAESADRVILIVRANRTRRETLARTLASFDLSKVLGFVLNDVDYSRQGYGEAYTYYAKEYLNPTKRQRRARTRVRKR